MPRDAKIRIPRSEEVYRTLVRGIMAGRFPVGMRMREERLCGELKVSRTPLREALIRLAREGLLERQPRRGCVVRLLLSGEIGELLECRRLTETLVLREWFSQLDMDEVRKLSDRLSKVRKGTVSNARDEILEVDERLHELIASSCDNRFMGEQLRSLQLQCRPYRTIRCADSADIAAALAERENMIDAILKGDVSKAESALSEHFENSRRYCSQSDDS